MTADHPRRERFEGLLDQVGDSAEALEEAQSIEAERDGVVEDGSAGRTRGTLEDERGPARSRG